MKTDLSIAIPKDTYARIAPRSGLAWKHFIDTGAGVVDYDYRGNVGVILFNHSDKDFEVNGHVARKRTPLDLLVTFTEASMPLVGDSVTELHQGVNLKPLSLEHAVHLHILGDEGEDCSENSGNKCYPLMALRLLGGEVRAPPPARLVPWHVHGRRFVPSAARTPRALLFLVDRHLATTTSRASASFMRPASSDGGLPRQGSSRLTRMPVAPRTRSTSRTGSTRSSS